MIGFGFASHWLKISREIFKLITKRSNRSRIITFDSHLKTALIVGLVQRLNRQTGKSLNKSRLNISHFQMLKIFAIIF